MKSTMERESALINHVWRECQKSATGTAIFHCEALAKEYLGEDKGLMDAWGILRELPELKISCTSPEKIKDFYFDISINPYFCTREFQEMSSVLKRLCMPSKRPE